MRANWLEFQRYIPFMLRKGWRV